MDFLGGISNLHLFLAAMAILCLVLAFSINSNRAKIAPSVDPDADVKKYILWVTTKHGDSEDEDADYSSRWYGWSQKLILTHTQALSEKAKIQDKYYDVEIVEI